MPIVTQRGTNVILDFVFKKQAVVTSVLLEYASAGIIATRKTDMPYMFTVVLFEVGR